MWPLIRRFCSNLSCDISEVATKYEIWSRLNIRTTFDVWFTHVLHLLWVFIDKVKINQYTCICFFYFQVLNERSKKDYEVLTSRSHKLQQEFEQLSVVTEQLAAENTSRVNELKVRSRTIRLISAVIIHYTPP